MRIHLGPEAFANHRAVNNTHGRQLHLRAFQQCQPILPVPAVRVAWNPHGHQRHRSEFPGSTWLGVYGGYENTNRLIRSIEQSSSLEREFQATSRDANQDPNQLNSGVFGFRFSPAKLLAIVLKGGIGRARHSLTPIAGRNYRALAPACDTRSSSFSCPPRRPPTLMRTRFRFRPAGSASNFGDDATNVTVRFDIGKHAPRFAGWSRTQHTGNGRSTLLGPPVNASQRVAESIQGNEGYQYTGCSSSSTRPWTTAHTADIQACYGRFDHFKLCVTQPV
jgi:hypothetical protein